MRIVTFLLSASDIAPALLWGQDVTSSVLSRNSGGFSYCDLPLRTRVGTAQLSDKLKGGFPRPRAIVVRGAFGTVRHKIA
jgi:hypothetical protein